MLLRRDTFGELCRQMNRLQNDMTFLFSRPESAAAFAAIPPVNVWEDAHKVFVEVDLPGIDADKIEVSVSDGNRLMLAAERLSLEIPNCAWHRHERGTGAVSRELTLPAMVDPAHVTAAYQDGVLRIELPKVEAAKPRKIAVKCT